MSRGSVNERLSRIESKLDQVLAHLEATGSRAPALPDNATPSPPPPAVPVPQDELWIDQALFVAMHQFERFPETLRRWLHENPGRWTYAEILADLSRRHPTAHGIGGVRLGAFMRRHQEWLGVISEKQGKKTFWRLAGRRP